MRKIEQNVSDEATPLKDNSCFSIKVTYEDDNFEEKTTVLKFRKRYMGRMKVLNLALAKFQTDMLDAVKALAKNAYVGDEKELFENDDIILSLAKHQALFIGNTVSELQLD